MRWQIIAVFVMVAVYMVPVMEAGFGCPGDQSKCNSHCRHIDCKAGYCDAWTLYFRCTCTRCSRRRGLRYVPPQDGDIEQ